MTQHIKEQVIPFEQLKSSDLIIDCVYQSGKDDHLGSEVISRLVPFCQNTGGFRWVKEALQKPPCQAGWNKNVLFGFS